MTDQPNATIEENKEVPAEAPAETPIMQAPAETILKSASEYATIVPGMTVRVFQRIKDVNKKGEEKERVQAYEGIVIARKHGREMGATITVRKMTEGIGIEKIFPLNSPTIDRIEIIKAAKVRRAKLYFLRTRPKKLRDKTLVAA